MIDQFLVRRVSPTPATVTPLIDFFMKSFEKIPGISKEAIKRILCNPAYDVLVAQTEKDMLGFTVSVPLDSPWDALVRVACTAQRANVSHTKIELDRGSELETRARYIAQESSYYAWFPDSMIEVYPGEISASYKDWTKAITVAPGYPAVLRELTKKQLEHLVERGVPTVFTFCKDGDPVFHACLEEGFAPMVRINKYHKDGSGAVLLGYTLGAGARVERTPMPKDLPAATVVMR